MKGKSTKPEIVGYAIKSDTALNKNSPCDADPGNQTIFHGRPQRLDNLFW